MITIKEIEKKTMSEEKKKSAKNDIFAFYIGRPLSYLFTIPFLYTPITPNMISYFSMLLVILAFVFSLFCDIYYFVLISWLLLFLWNIFDGVDGNIARYKKIFSKNGSVVDAMSGYLAMFFSFFSFGIIAAKYYNNFFDTFDYFDSNYFIIFGSLSGFLQIFPRLIHHKKMNSNKDFAADNSVADKANFNLIKKIGLNITSIAGFVQLIMLFIVVLGFFKIYLFDIFTLLYFFINLSFCALSIYKILVN